MQRSARSGKNTLANRTGNLEDALAEMRRDFAATLPDRRHALITAWRDLAEGDWSADSVEAAYRVVHSLAGAAETFGFSDLGQAARALNDAVHDLRPGPTTADQRAKAERLCAQVFAAFDRP